MSQDDCTRFQQFLPGHYYSSKTSSFTRYYNPKFYLDFEAQPQRFPDTPYDPVVLRKVGRGWVSAGVGAQPRGTHLGEDMVQVRLAGEKRDERER